MTTVSKRLAAILVLAVAPGAIPAIAGTKNVYRDFYQAKRQATTPAAYRRAEDNLRAVTIGMSELQFLETMQMQVLANHGKPYDAQLDGYLPAASADANLAAETDERFLVLGYTEDGHEVPRIRVTLVSRRVTAIEPCGSDATDEDEPLIARAQAPDDAAEGTR